MTDSVKYSRPHRSAVRAEQAERTRRRIVDAAAHLFVEHGYTGTALSAEAEAAEEAQETIYATFGSKRGLLEALIDATLMGPEVPVPLEEQSAWAESERLPTASERLRAYVRFSCSVLARTSPVHRVVRGASDGEPFAVDLRARLLSDRLASNTRRLGQYIGDELRTGLTLDQAAERYCALSSPEMYHLLTVELGWSQNAYEDWLAALADREILGHPG